MDTVDTFNHLLPSDQLDDSPLIGPNLECEAGKESGEGLLLEDSLKNMLSDKDPMLASASSHFNLLDNEESTFPMDSSTGLCDGSTSTGLSGAAGELTVSDSLPVKRPVGRPRKRPHNLESEQSGDQDPAKTSAGVVLRGRTRSRPGTWQPKSFLIEKGVQGSQLKKELTLGGRVNVHDLEGGFWLNPTVELRRLTVTIGGFRIELLPGPSYAENADTSQLPCLEDGFSYAGDIEFTMLHEGTVSVQNSVSENAAQLDVVEKCGANDAPLGLGPYVNPNDVQTANGTVMNTSEEAKLEGEDDNSKHKIVSSTETDGAKQQLNTENTAASVSNKTDSKEKEEAGAKKLLKPKQEMTPNKNKGSDLCRPSSTIKGHKVSLNMPPKVIEKVELNNMKALKAVKVAVLKRPAENSQGEHATKVQRVQDAGQSKEKPKLPLKKTVSSGSRSGDQQAPSKPPPVHVASPSKCPPPSHLAPKAEAVHPPPSRPAPAPKAEAVHPPPSRPGPSPKAPEDGVQVAEKPKPKKPEKILLKPKSKNVRSISVDEPQLFIPDNAPVVKKEAADEAANSDSAWDGNNCCGLCKKHHNNMFMVGCGRCDDWFHGDCVGLDLTKVREMEEEDQMYVCLKCCEDESTKVEPEVPSVAKPEEPVKNELQDIKPPPAKPRHGPSQSLTSGGMRPVRKDSERRTSTESKHLAHKTASKKVVSVEQIRRNVRVSLKEILQQRLKESNLEISLERASEVAKKTERELFHLYKDTDNKYKNKYRSLMFNLKDTKNNVLCKRVLKGEISPANLVRMSPEELASKELAAWRQRENRHTIEMIEKEQREVERRPITKITHKGEIEIEIETPEPVKAPETTKLEPPAKTTDASEAQKQPKTPEKNAENTKTDKDTTDQHKSHLFDLHCKICTGRMAPPVEEVPTKVVKVATTVVRRQSTKAEEANSKSPGATEEDLHLSALEDSFQIARPTSYDGRLEHVSGRDEENAFLSGLKALWRGFLNMPCVAKLVTRAFPVSGILDNLTEDLPDSVQVGGRISPQTVWDYLEKIRATGTKEVCLIRFAPETEEDEISYTLLYAYFSSRKRFGVVSNNLKQVKDMYLIPLSATEKVPHQLVPFDGPGLENNRANLLLGLIIRQRPKRDFMLVGLSEAVRIVPEIEPQSISPKETQVIEEKLYLSSLTAAPTKQRDIALVDIVQEAEEPPLEESSVPEKPNSQEAQKPLRFLPGVLVGWGGELPPLPDFGGLPAVAEEPLKSPPPPKAEALIPGLSKSPAGATPRDRYVIKKKETKAVKAESDQPSQTIASPPPSSTSSSTLSSSSSSPSSCTAHSQAAKEAPVTTQAVSVSLKDKPPDVSTEAFLTSLSTAPSENQSAASADAGDAGLPSESEKEKPEGNSPAQPKSQVVADHIKPPLSGILKKTSAYSSVKEDKKTTELPKNKVNQPEALSPIPVPVSSSTRSDPIVPVQPTHVPQAQHKHKEQSQTNIKPLHSEVEAAGVSHAGAAAAAPSVYHPEVEGPEAATSTVPTPTEASDLLQDSVAAPALSGNNTAAPFPPLQQQSQVSGSYDDPSHPSHPSSDTSFTTDAQDQNPAKQWAEDGASHALPGLDGQYPESVTESSGQPSSQAKEDRRQDERYVDPWERPRHTEDKDYKRHRDSHHGKKSKYHERERGKKHDHSYEDKYRERSRYHGHSENRHGDKRRERHHSDDYSSRHKDKHRHRRDSDYENGRRSSKDSYL
ncbi:PHD finger protein 3 [Genypterus blacodes]|uniref:PHD finger protein 3 n=1 Tax=Genypterus blacodes TaxID=154954 RepID=UPI003F75D72C